MDKKTFLRLRAKEIRKTLDIKHYSNILVEKISGMELYKKSKNIMIYYPLDEEINLLDLIQDDGKNFYLPRMNGKSLECCPYKKTDTLVCSKYNIMEPQTECIICPKLDLIIVPALAADKDGNRLGYGGGFYDRFLAGMPDIPTLVALPESLVFENIPTEKFDIKIDYVVY